MLHAKKLCPSVSVFSLSVMYHVSLLRIMTWLIAGSWWSTHTYTLELLMIQPHTHKGDCLYGLYLKMLQLQFCRSKFQVALASFLDAVCSAKHSVLSPYKFLVCGSGNNVTVWSFRYCSSSIINYQLLICAFVAGTTIHVGHILHAHMYMYMCV